MNENAQKYFKLYNKSKMTKEKSEQMLANLELERKYLENVLYSIEKCESLDELNEIKEELGIFSTNMLSSSSTEQKILAMDVNGFNVYVGKNNKQNDYIISKLSKEEDYWFHTRLCAGSHVLLSVRNIEPNEDTLYQCCKLAKEYSSASLSSKVGVVYTKRKFIKKPPKAPLGYVIYKNEKEVIV